MSYGRVIGEMFVGMLVIALVAGATFTGLLFWLLPKLWDWLKPIIHAATGA